MIRFLPIKKYINNQNGMALVVVLLVLTVIAIMGVSILAFSVNNLKMASIDRNYQATYYTAESGITLMESQIKQTASTVCNNSTNMTNFVNGISDQSATYQNGDFSKVNDLQPSTTVTGIVKSRDSTNGLVNIQIQSKGTIGNSNRAVTKTIQIKCTPGSNGSPLTILNDMAVFTNTNLFFSSTITGNIGTNCITGNCNSLSSGYTPITIDWGGKLTGSINAPNPSGGLYKKPSSMSFNPIVNNIQSRPFNTQYSLPEFPVFPTDLPKRANILSSGGTDGPPITADGYYDQITLQSGRTLTINVGSQNRKIVVNKLHLDQGFVKVVGDKDSSGKLIGSLTLYIENEFVFGGLDNKGNPSGDGSSTINQDGSSSSVNIYYKGSQLLKLGGNIRVNANVYTKNSNIFLGGSGSIIGDIIAANATQIDITGGSNTESRFILAPIATINVNGGAAVKGSVICNNFNLTGGATLTYGKIDDTNPIPFYPPSNNSSSTVTVTPIIAVREINN